MSLSVRTSSLAGNPRGGGEDWGDSPYGSLITLGPKTFKKKPVLVLAAEELAEAHLAMAMGGAEIMDMQPDPVAAPRPRQPSIMLGLVPMGIDEAEVALPPYTPPAPVAEDDDYVWEPLPEFDEPEPEEAEVQTWFPDDEPEDVADLSASAEEEWADLAPAPAFEPAPEPQVPSIEEQLERMRERLAKRAAATAASAPAVPPAPPVAEPLPSTIERLEIDDWSSSASLKGFIPPQERDLPPAPPPTPAPASGPAPIPAPPPVVAQPAPDPEPEPEPEVFAPAPVTFRPEPPREPVPVEPDMPDVLDLEEQAALDAWADHVAPVAPAPRRHAGIRARLSDHDDWQGGADEPGPSLFARLWAWLRGRF